MGCVLVTERIHNLVALVAEYVWHIRWAKGRGLANPDEVCR
jgi:hypothetical protein